MEQERRYSTLIADQFPELNIRTVESLGEGYRNYAILVNGEWVFRFPKSQQGADELNKEMHLLPLLAGRVKVGIPKFVYRGTQEDGRPFAGYRKVEGEILGEDGIASVSDYARERLAIQLGDFLNDLNACPVETAIQAGVPVQQLANEIHLLKAAAERQVFPHIEPSWREYLNRRFQAYLEDSAYTRYIPALIHADLSPDHFLTDCHRSVLTGIIDFGDAAISDPDYDYLYLLEDCGAAFTRQVMAHKGETGLDARMRKISLFVTFDQVRYLLEGLESKDPDWIQEGFESVEQDMRINR
ncbi:phosphotransferase family protein [Paenibacillus jilunlii]|uniref:Aminoglycoside 2''-phosphotransferase n=1 Tax=Paenibacillus jilunlii TaxID=682956 RepID=A0A1G9KSD2_9BACL|nr:aminoglycoside phosphotransferase family protein [Paenibacillus jilunlii]SDL52582.1 aminoglycoside 2''-phosphotransferase [Paenibacillus jilunlii]